MTTLDYSTRLRLEREAAQNAKPGDTFYAIRYGHVIAMTAAKPVLVERVTKTQIVLANGDRLKRNSGDLVGTHLYTRVQYRPALPHVVAEIEAAQVDHLAALEFGKQVR